MNRLAGKVAIVTGAARGMGEATARLFAAEGASVVLADVLDASGESVASEIGSAAFFQHHDVRDEESWRNIAGSAARRFGGIDVLVNNAGVLKTQSLLEVSKEDFDEILAVNLVGAFLGIKTIAPYMIERNKGSIINISSVSGMIGQATVGAYAGEQMGVAWLDASRSTRARTLRRARQLCAPRMDTYRNGSWQSRNRLDQPILCKHSLEAHRSTRRNCFCVLVPGE